MNFKNNYLLSRISRDLFLTAFLLFIIFVFLELLKQGIIINYINLEIYLLLLFLLGIGNILLSQPVKKNPKINFGCPLFLFIEYNLYNS